MLAPHEGLISSDIWIKCRSKCLGNSSVAKPVKAKATWLAGKVKCAHCGYALSAKVYHCKTKADNRYYLCNNKYNTDGCSFGSLDADVVDEIVFEELQKKLAEFSILSKQKQGGYDLQTIRLKTRMEGIDQEIASLLDKIPLANRAVMEYINDRVAALDAEKKELYAEIVQLTRDSGHGLDEITGYMKDWEKISMSDKLTVVDSLIECIYASQEKIKINWKI